MYENTSIASKAASIVLGLNRSGRKFATGSSISQPVSPYFNNTVSNRPLADLTNFYMENMEKVPFKCDIARTRMISSKDVSKHKVKTKKNDTSTKMTQSDENFFDNLLKNMDENLKKTRGLSTSGVNKLPQKKKKSLCNDATLKLVHDFKETLKGTKANTIPFTVTNDDENAPPAQMEVIDPQHIEQDSLSLPPTLEKMPYIQKYSSVNANYDSEDLFDLSLLQRKKHSKMNQSSSIKTPSTPSSRTSQSNNYSMVSNESYTTRDVDYNSFMTSSFDNIIVQQSHDDSKVLKTVDVSPSRFSLDSPDRIQFHQSNSK